MGGTSAPALLVEVHLLNYYFNCQSLLSQVVAQDPALESPDFCTLDFCHLLLQEAKGLVA